MRVPEPATTGRRELAFSNALRLIGQARDLRHAIRLCEKMAAAPRADTRLFSIHARLLDQAGQYTQALSAWRQAIRRSRTNVLGRACLRESLARTLRALGRDREAQRQIHLAATAWRAARRRRLHSVIRDDVKLREAHCLALLHRPPEARRLIGQVARGPNARVFEQDIRELLEEHPSVAALTRTRRPWLSTA